MLLFISNPWCGRVLISTAEVNITYVISFQIDAYAVSGMTDKQLSEYIAGQGHVYALRKFGTGMMENNDPDDSSKSDTQAEKDR